MRGAAMSDFEPGFDAIRRADRIVDALSTGRRVPSNDPADLEVASLLAHWRDDIRRGPVPELVSTRQAAAALSRAQQPHRGRFVPTVVGAVAAAMLCLGGFGTVLYDSHPGDTLYGLRTFVFGESEKTKNDQVALAAQSQLLEVQNLIAQGQWDQAQDRLAAASTAVRDVPDLPRKQELIDQMNQLTVKVEARDANVVLPPGAPPPAPLPGMVVPLPNVVEAPPSSSDATTTTTTTTTITTSAPGTTSTSTPTTTTSPGPVQVPPPVDTTTTSLPTTIVTTTAPAPVTTTPSPVTTTPAPVTTTTAAATTAATASAPAVQAPAVVAPSSVASPAATSAPAASAPAASSPVIKSSEVATVAPPAAPTTTQAPAPTEAPRPSKVPSVAPPETTPPAQTGPKRGD
jgi:hypothetical protein